MSDDLISLEPHCGQRSEGSTTRCAFAMHLNVVVNSQAHCLQVRSLTSVDIGLFPSAR